MTGLAVSASAQLRALVVAFLLGVLLGALYDGFFLLRALLGAHTGKRGRSRLSAYRYPLLPPDFGQKEQGRVRAGVSLAITAILDFLYALAGGILFLLFTYAQSEGVFRFYYLVAATLGLLSYRVTLGRVARAFSVTLVFLLRLLLSYLALFVRVPTVWLLHTAKKALAALFLLLLRPLYGLLILSLRKRSASRACLPVGLPI